MMKTNVVIFALLVSAVSVAASMVSAQEQDKVILGVWGGSSRATYEAAFAKQFTKETGYEVVINELPSPSAAIVAANGQPDFNVAVGTYFEVAQLGLKGLIADFAPDELSVFTEYPDELLPKSADGTRIMAVPLSYLFYGIAYNTELAKAEDFKSWQSLIDPKWKDQIAVTRPVYLSTYDVTLAAYLNDGNEENIEPGLPFLKAMLDNALSVYSSMGNFNSMIAQGEIVAGPYYSSLKRLSRESGANFDIVLPDEGGLMLPYAMMQTKNSKGNKAVEAWMNYVGSRAGQERASAEMLFPLNPNATVSPELEGAFGLSSAELREKLFKPDWNVIAAKQEERARLIEQMIGELGVK